MALTEKSNKKTAAALGLFDGVHLGHMEVLHAALKTAEREELSPAVFTFRTETVTSKGRIEPLLTEEDKLSRLKQADFERIFSADFADLKDMSAEQFVKNILCDKLNAAYAVCGEDFRFGRGGNADCEDLTLICAEYGIEVCAVKLLEIGGKAVSSTRIRELIGDGRISEANVLLGYKYGYRLPVIHGFERGRTWDFPTINQAIPKGLALPRFGVYCAKVKIDDKWYPGVTNIGVKPTVEKTSPPLAETFIIDYNGDLYGRTLELKLYEFVRPERVFPSFEELKAEISRNTEFTRNYFEKTERNEYK